MNERDKSSMKAENEPPDMPAHTSSTIGYSLYSLRIRNVPPPTLGQIVAVAVAAAVYTILSWLAIITLPSGIPVVSSVFIAIGFGIPFALWFGGWAFVIAYIGNFVGAGLLQAMPLPVALIFGTVDLIQLGLPVILYRTLAKHFGVSPIGKDIYTVRGFLFFLFCAVLPNNIIGGLYGNFILVQSGIAPPNTFLLGWFAWSLSNVIITSVVGSILLKVLGPVVERFGLTVQNAFS